MADNIQIVGEILDIQQVSRYNEEDARLLTASTLVEDFGQTNDYIEYFIYDISGNLLRTNYNYKDFKSPNTSFVTPTGSLPIIEIDPVKDLQNLGYSSGEFNVQYNFFNNKVSNSSAELFLKEISADRTELRIGSTILTNEQIESGSITLINEYTNSAYFVNYLVNFGDNYQALTVNVALNKVESGYEILFKLYEPLPINIQEKSSLWIVKEKINPYSFNINLDRLVIPSPLPQLRGPNFDINVPNQNNVATSYQTYAGLISNVNSISTSSYQQLLSLMTSQSIDINVDYTDRNDFIFFSSAKARLVNFYNKVKEIQDYNSFIATYNSSVATTSSLALEITASKNAINTIISQFDGYEYYLYFESSSYAWPKTNSTLPYILASTASANSWYTAATASAETYDGDNPNYIINTLPTFIRDDNNNAPYLTFIEMIGHYFDNIWIFIKSVTDINLANNNLEKGVSKDLVYYVLQSLGTKLYNQYGDSNNTNFLIGQSGSAYYTGSDTQAFTYTGSYLNTIPRKDLLAESYKRIYHNLPLLLKTKGTAYGLQTLVSTFGITGSTLQVKEYGGDTKAGLLDEFNNDKVRVISSTITGSTLSPFISLQTYPTASTLFRTNDLHYIDISFSPQDKIDIFTSASIAMSASVTWSIDDFIGDPRYQYLGSYPTLDIERTTYLSPLTASIVPFTGSAGSGSIAATDYNSFIRLIQFFDNSLFKMLKDYVPARTSLSTGVTISSPILERNKWVIANPSSTSEIEVEDGTINGPEISSEYTDIYSYLTGSKVAYYDGNITGSYINVYAYFESSSINPYLFPTSSINTSSFNHSDFNVLLNNVSQSILSRARQGIQFVPGTTQTILSPVELQDSYESLRTHQLSRYDGVKISSLYYNTYTSASDGYVGDISFGKTAVIDHNVSKLGIFSEVVASRFLPKRNNAVLKYLVNKDGELTELNLRNKHWEEIQNTFKAGRTGSISQFNSQLYGNQKTTDGEKIIFSSGYSYSPILYFPSCSVAGGYNNISFQNQGSTSAYLTTAQNLNTSYIVNGGFPIGYPVISGSINNIFNQPTEQYSWYATGSGTVSSSYTVSETGQYKVYANMSMNIAMTSVNSATWSLQMVKGTNVEAQHEIKTYFGDIPITCYNYTVHNDSADEELFYTFTNCATGVVTGRRKVNPLGSVSNICSREDPTIVEGSGYVSIQGSCGTYQQPGITNTTLNFTIDKGYNNNDYYNATDGDILSFRLKLVGITDLAGYTASLNSGGSLSIGSLATSTGYSVIGCSPSYISNVTTSSITFNAALSSFYNANYMFVPNPISGSTSALYDEYGDVDYVFAPKANDILILYLSDKSIVEYNITNVTESINGRLILGLDSSLSELAQTNLTSANNQYDRFLLLSRQPDETNVITTFQKRDGKTSYGFLIPDIISSDVLNNIDTITKEVKQKLLNDQPLINDINGGTFGP
jgi:hypothetical protein